MKLYLDYSLFYDFYAAFQKIHQFFLNNSLISQTHQQILNYSEIKLLTPK
jgi:hypothetical protein